MAVAIPVFYEIFAFDMASGRHDLANDPLAVALTNVVPNPVTHESRSQIAEIISGNGYGSGGVAFPPQTLNRVGRTANLILPGAFLLASGDLPAWRWAVLFNTTNSRLILSWDYGAPGIAMAAGDNMEFAPEEIALAVGLAPT